MAPAPWSHTAYDHQYYSELAATRHPQLAYRIQAYLSRPKAGPNYKVSTVGICQELMGLLGLCRQPPSSSETSHRLRLFTSMPEVRHRRLRSPC